MERRVDPSGGRFERRFWRLFDEAFWIRSEGAVEGFLAGCIDFIGLTVMDLIWRHQADAGMVMILIIPVEKTAAERLRVLDAAEPLRRLGLASRGELSPSALSDPSVRTLASLGSHQVNASFGSPRQCTKRPALSRAVLVRNCPAQVFRPLKRLNFRITHARNV